MVAGHRTGFPGTVPGAYYAFSNVSTTITTATNTTTLKLVTYLFSAIWKMVWRDRRWEEVRRDFEMTVVILQKRDEGLTSEQRLRTLAQRPGRKDLGGWFLESTPHTVMTSASRPTLQRSR